MSTKYKTTFGTNIEAVEVVKETDKSVWLHGFRMGGGEGPLRRADKRTNWESYHDTWEEARGYILDLAESELEDARLALQRAQGKVGSIKGMKNPGAKE